jgi:hypothetical protein
MPRLVRGEAHAGAVCSIFSYQLTVHPQATTGNNLSKVASLTRLCQSRRGAASRIPCSCSVLALIPNGKIYNDFDTKNKTCGKTCVLLKSISICKMESKALCDMYLLFSNN